MSSSISIKLLNELKELPFQDPVASSLPELSRCGSKVNGSCTMLHHEQKPSKSTDCLLQQVQGGQQESRFIPNKPWSFPYCEDIPSTRVGQSLLNNVTATGSCNVVKGGSSYSDCEYSHNEKFGLAKEEIAVNQLHCRETAKIGISPSQEEESRTDEGKQSPYDIVNTASTKVRLKSTVDAGF